VVIKEEDKLFSIIKQTIDSKYAICYEVGKSIVPKYGYIFAFNNLPDAVRFSDTVRFSGRFVHVEIYKCVADVVDIKEKYIIYSATDLNKINPRSFKAIQKGTCKKFKGENAPEGAVLCSSIILLRKVS
jgi:hypothetical protein